MEIKYVRHMELSKLEREVNELCEQGWEPFLPLIRATAYIQPMKRGETFIGVQNSQVTIAYDLENILGLEDEQASEALIDSESRSA